MKQRSDFRAYQEWMTRKAIEKKFVALWAEQGLGKTAATLYAIKELLERGVTKKWLIIAPLLVAEVTWPDEIAEWKEIRSLKYSVVTGSEKERIAALASPAPIHIINRENIIWLWTHLRGQFPYDGLVYDESSRLAGGKLRTKPAFARLKHEIGELVLRRQDARMNDPLILELDRVAYNLLGPSEAVQSAMQAIDDEITRKQRDMKPRITEFGVVSLIRERLKACIQLTGTPTPQGLMGVWGQMFILDRGERLRKTLAMYTRKWFDTNRYTRKVTVREGAHAEIMELCSDIAFALKSDDYLKLPDRIFNPVWINLPEKVMAQYRELEREFVLEEHDIEAVNSGVLASKLLQLCNGSIYKGPEKEIIQIHDEKLDALELIVEQAAGRPVLVAYEFQFDLAKIRKRFPKAVILKEEKDVIRKWNAGQIQLLVTHPASAAHGLNMQYGGSIAVWYGLTWSLEWFLQFNKRLHRSGQIHTVMIHMILARKTYDERQYKSLIEKTATQDSVTEAVRVLLPRHQPAGILEAHDLI